MTTVDARAVMRAVRDRDPSERIRLLQTIKPRLPEQYVPHVPHPTQQLFLLQNGREVLFGGGGGGGKALWVHIYIPTPTGWTTMGDIRAGDEVLGTDGRPCRVLAVSGVMYDHDCYEVTFSDGSMLIADAGHMWTVVDDAGEQSTITTREVRNHVKELSVPAVTARGVAYPPRRITSVTPRVSVPVQCITVDSHDHLFLAGRSMIPTHNSDALLMAALAYVDVPGYSALILRRTWPDLSLPGAIMDRAREWLQGTDAEPRDGGRVWRFPSGARLSFGYLQHDKDKFNYQCFTPDTEILTVDGWKPVADVQVGDPVATVSPESGAMHYFAVTKTYDYDFDGQMIDIFQKNGVSFTVTPNHTIFAGTEKVPTLKQYRADQLPYTATIPQTFDWKGVRPSTMLFPAGSRGTDLVFDGTTWVEFLGWYIAEGNCGSYNGRWEVKISQNKEQGRNQIESVLGRVAGLNAHWNDNGVSMNNRALVEYLKAHTETGDDGPPAYAKCLPEYVFRWDAEYAELLLKTLVAGDGTVYTHGTRSDGQMVFVSYSRRLADDVMRLAVHAGWRPTLLEHDGGDYKPGTTCYRVSLSKRTRQTALAGKQREVDYTGKVHCVTVEPYNNLVIRHRGRVSLSGNSAEFHYVAFDELTQFLESTYTYMFSRVRKPVVACARCRRPVAKYFADGIATVQWKHTESKTTRCDDPTPNLQSLREYGPAPDGTTLFDVPLRVRSASNPGGVGGAWVRDRFVNPATRVKGAVFIPSLLSDNPSLDQETYRHNLEHLSPVDRERLLNGDWDITEQGDYFQRHWFTFLDDIPRDTRIRWVRYWDLAATEKGDWTAGCLLGLTTEGQWIVADVRRMRGTPYEVERFIAATAATDGTGVAIRMEQEPGSSGVNTIDHYRRRVLVGYDFKPDKKTASKTVRANPVSSAAEAGNIILITGAWNREFLDEITVYPRGSHDDMTDSLTGAFSMLARTKGHLLV